jgi:hypothetical protein
MLLAFVLGQACSIVPLCHVLKIFFGCEPRPPAGQRAPLSAFLCDFLRFLRALRLFQICPEKHDAIKEMMQ